MTTVIANIFMLFRQYKQFLKIIRNDKIFLKNIFILLRHFSDLIIINFTQFAKKNFKKSRSALTCLDIFSFANMFYGLFERFLITNNFVTVNVVSNSHVHVNYIAVFATFTNFVSNKGRQYFRCL